MAGAGGSSPIIGSGFRLVCVKRNAQWLSNLHTGSKVVVAFDKFMGSLNIQEDVIRVTYEQVLPDEDNIIIDTMNEKDPQCPVPVGAFKFFDKHRMTRADGSYYIYDKKHKVNSGVSWNFKTGTSTVDKDFAFLVFEFANAPHVCNLMIRAMDLQSAIGLARSDAVDVKWIQRNWDSWKMSFEKGISEDFRGLRSHKSVKTLHDQKPQEFAKAELGKNCMEEWCFSFLECLWVLIYIHFKTITAKTSDADEERSRTKNVFSKLLSIVLPPSQTFLIPVKMSTYEPEDTKFSNAPSFTKPDAFIPIHGSNVQSFDNLLSQKDFGWLKKSLQRTAFICIYIYIFIYL